MFSALRTVMDASNYQEDVQEGSVPRRSIAEDQRSSRSRAPPTVIPHNDLDPSGRHRAHSRIVMIFVTRMSAGMARLNVDVAPVCSTWILSVEYHQRPANLAWQASTVRLQFPWLLR